MTGVTQKGLIGKKIGMTRMANDNGQIIPVTLLKIEGQKVTKLLSTERDGYQAYQVGYSEKTKKNITKADTNRLRKVGIEENFSQFKEFRAGVEGLTLGDVLTLEAFKGVKTVDVTGIVKGRGYQGAVKRWGVAIGRMTHGSRFHRRPGSLGSNTSPGRVYKNKPQPGHMGDSTKTIKNLTVMDMDLQNNVIALKGSVPGFNGGYIQITAVT